MAQKRNRGRNQPGTARKVAGEVFDVTSRVAGEVAERASDLNREIRKAEADVVEPLSPTAAEVIRPPRKGKTKHPGAAKTSGRKKGRKK